LLGVAVVGWLALACTLADCHRRDLAAIPLAIIGLALVGLSRAMRSRREGGEEAAK